MSPGARDPAGSLGLSWDIDPLGLGPFVGQVSHQRKSFWRVRDGVSLGLKLIPRLPIISKLPAVVCAECPVDTGGCRGRGGGIKGSFTRKVTLEFGTRHTSWPSHLPS